MTTDDFTKLGIPKLPEGYFYRIRLSKFAEFLPLTVEIRKKMRIGSYKLYLLDESCCDTESSIREACLELYNRFISMDEKRQQYVEIVDKYVGDHR